MGRVQVESREKLIIRQVPHPANDATEKQVFRDFSKLIFTPGPFPASDELNFNDGLEANPFDKIAKVYGRNKDLFLFNGILRSPEKRSKILEIVEQKCVGFEGAMKRPFVKRMNIYLDRISGGREDAKEAMGDTGGIQDVFFHGCHFGKRGQVRNIHQNLNINVATGGATLDTKGIATGVTPRMVEEGSKLERVKIYGNGKRIMNVVKGADGQRNYSFSKLAKMELEIKWSGRRDAKTGDEVECSVVLEMNAGRISLKSASVGGAPVEIQDILGYCRQNEEVLVRNKSLCKVLEEISGAQAFDCRSTEKLVILPPTTGPMKTAKDALKEVIAAVEKLDFSGGPCDNPDDKLNYNEGLSASPWNKLRKFYGREKNLFWLIAVLRDEECKEELMNLVRGRCGEAEVKEFEHRMEIFLERMARGEEDVKIFFGAERLEGMGKVSGVFAGPELPHAKHPKRNIHANLNLLVEELRGVDLMTKEILDKETPRIEGENGELVRIKIFGGDEKILTVHKEVEGRRNYQFLRFFKNGTLEVTWSGREKEEGDGGKLVGRECTVTLEVKDGRVTIRDAKIDEEEVDPGRILDCAKDNDQVCFRQRSFYEAMKLVVKKGGFGGKGKECAEEAGGGGVGNKLEATGGISKKPPVALTPEQEQKLKNILMAIGMGDLYHPGMPDVEFGEDGTVKIRGMEFNL